MQTKIQKWGNSLAVRIPKAIAEETLLKENSTVELTVEAGVLCVTPRRRKMTLRALLDAITEDNIHDEVSTGKPVGKEAW